MSASVNASTLGTAGFSLANGVWTKSINSLSIAITLSTQLEATGSSFFTGVAVVIPNGDVAAADAASAAAVLQGLGIGALTPFPVSNVQFEDLGANGFSATPPAYSIGF
jgi:hypothetical protein